MKRLFYIAAAAMAVLSACTKEEIPQDIELPAVNTPVFTATMENTDTKATFNDVNKCASWEVRDEISINGYSFLADAAGTITSFSSNATQEIRPSYVSSSSTGFSGETPDKLVDDAGVDTKWCANTTSHRNGDVWDIVVSTGSPVLLKYIKLWNGGDTGTETGRRWKTINVYGSASNDGGWENIKTNLSLSLEANNNGVAGTIAIDAKNEYTYYKVEILANESGTTMQMSDMKFGVPFNDVRAPYKAYFPATLYNEGTSALPAKIRETWADGRFNMPMYATSNNTDLAFKNLCGVLKIIVKNDQFKKVKGIRVSSANKAVSGAFSVDADNAAVLTAPDAVANKLTVTYTDAVATTAEGTVFYVAIPAQSYRELKIELSSNGDSFFKSMVTRSDMDIEVERNKIYPITFAGIETPSYGSHEAVDLGLSVKWATMNVGATKPEEFGDYFAWGATEPYYEDGYARENPGTHWKSGKEGGYLYVNAPYQTENTNSSGYQRFTKYLGSTTSLYKNSSATDENALKTVLDPEDDAAHVNWGGDWRMPTKEEFEELINNCTLTIVGASDNSDICKAVSKVEGYTDKFIVFPMGGSRMGNTFNSDRTGNCVYWTSTLFADERANIARIDYALRLKQTFADDRNSGNLIRPVCD